MPAFDEHYVCYKCALHDSRVSPIEMASAKMLCDAIFVMSLIGVSDVRAFRTQNEIRENKENKN